MESQIFRIVFEDPELLVIEKQRPFLSQRGDQGSKEGLDEFLSRTLGKKIFGVHRLDREVLGLMIYGKTPKAAEHLSNQFKVREVQKLYAATVQGSVHKDQERLIHYLRKNPKTNHVTVFPRETEGAKRAELMYFVTSREGKTTNLIVRLETGRTHQIRAQLAKLGHPIVGDQRYGRAQSEDQEGIQLKSIYLSVLHPASHQRLEWCVSPSVDPKKFLEP